MVVDSVELVYCVGHRQFLGNERFFFDSFPALLRTPFDGRFYVVYTMARGLKALGCIERPQVLKANWIFWLMHDATWRRNFRTSSL